MRSSRPVLGQRKNNALLGEFFASLNKKRVEKDKPVTRATQSQGLGWMLEKNTTCRERIEFGISRNHEVYRALRPAVFG
jgi:hypothetical protein